MARVLGVLLLSFAAALPAAAGQETARFTVSVRVPARAAVTTVEPAAVLEVSAADVERGYAELAARYRVDSTGTRGYLLQVAPRVGLADRVEISGLGVDVVLADLPIEIYRSAAGCGTRGCTDELALRLRLLLNPAARPGRYPLPVQLDARPL